MGVSVSSQDDIWRIGSLKSTLPQSHKLVSFEPLHGPIQADLSGLEWVIIGAESGNRKGKIEPEEDWVKSVFNCWPDDLPMPVFMKNNLMPYLPEWSQIKEFPKEMQR